MLDFGLAKLTEQHTASTDTQAPTLAKATTDPGTVLGTVNYMSPEQARGKPVDARSDIFSLGVVIYEMAAGRAPFEGETPSGVIALILHKEPPPLVRYSPDVPAELERIVAKALAKDKEERYQSAKDLLIDLKRLKQRQEFEAELERSVSPNTISGAAVASASGSGAVSTGKAFRTTSSAEYIVTQIGRHKLAAVVTLMVLLAGLIGLYFLLRPATRPNPSVSPQADSISSVAVLPFVNAGSNEDIEYLSDGISEALINNLSQLSQLKVIARSSSFRYKGKEVDVREAARTLGAGAVVTGRVLERGGNLRISVEVINATDGTQIWGEQYSRPATDIQAVESEISRQIAERLRLKLTGAQQQQLARRATESPEAYQLYLNGRLYSRKGGIEGYRKALDYYSRAVALDPRFALAHAKIADIYRILGYNGLLDPKEAAAKGKAAVQKALELDEGLAEGHRVLAGFKMNEWDWEGAEREFRRAIDLNPNLVAARLYYSDYLMEVGRFDEAMAEIKRAQELDPLRVAPQAQEGVILLYARRYDEALQRLRYTLELEPENGSIHLYLGYTYAAMGRYEEAIAAYQKQMSIEGEMTSTLCYLGHAYARAGKRAEALSVLDKLRRTKEYVSPTDLAILYIGLGDIEAAFGSLERAYAAHDLQLQNLKIEPVFDPLRDDPRFQDLVRRVGLPQ